MQGSVAFAVALSLLLLPVQCVLLPGNMALVDAASAIVLPLLWVWMAHTRKPVRLPFFPAILLLLTATAAASLRSPDPAGSATVLIKEVYLYLWFVSLACAFESLSPDRARLLWWSWLAAGITNGAWILAQFADPALLVATNRALAGIGSVDPYRPSGLFENCNAAALYQASLFVPLLALHLPPRRTVLLAAVLLLMMLATGSMGAVLAFALGTTALLAGLLLTGQWTTAVRLLTTAVVAGVGLGVAGIVALYTVPHAQERLQYVMTGRSEYSAESRFAIWSRGTGRLLAEPTAFGVGPDMWKQLDGHELHNDLLSFAVERGPLALFALLVLVAAVASRCVALARRTTRDHVAALALPASLVAMAAMSQTHEVLHQRPVWLILAALEATWWRTLARRTPAANPVPLPRPANA